MKRLSDEDYDKKLKAHLQKVRERAVERQRRKMVLREVSPHGLLGTMRYGNRSGSHVNCFRFHPQNSLDHELAKFCKFVELRLEGCDVMTEAIFLNGSRADLVDLSRGCVHEVLCTETKESCERKVLKYPECFAVEMHTVKEVLG